jgi:hypothetical protein
LVAGGVTASSILQAGRNEVLPSWSQGAAARFSFEASRRALDHKRRCQLLVAGGVTLNSWSQAEAGCGVQCTVQAAAGRGSDQVGHDKLIVTGGGGASFSSALASFLVAHGVAVSSWSQQHRGEIW